MYVPIAGTCTNWTRLFAPDTAIVPILVRAALDCTSSHQQYALSDLKDILALWSLHVAMSRMSLLTSQHVGGMALQVAFLNVVALPLFSLLKAVLPGAQRMLDAATKNYWMWHKVAQTEGKHS